MYYTKDGEIINLIYFEQWTKSAVKWSLMGLLSFTVDKMFFAFIANSAALYGCVNRQWVEFKIKR